MVKKVKRFIVFMLFSFFYSLLGSKEADAAAKKICIIPKNSDGKMVYNGSSTGIDVDTVAASADCYN